ncbi:NAD(P)-binding oxidoreductase [Halalkalibacter sp. APA_J-10(15)]|uniref:NAD(P)H-binding protein n=1 Tax=Halalkalibacter sp. APA_J-10(15) TaxID=2933805 RepID=UPI001FF68A54|nr:NAD(P)-binding oxidoreductase [Halalkalibacter sp. APA_J-10(15)]MCK0469852.1 SDR family oxidoreductase [Halalkalibacter sp. APA_J-10(15)]
MRVLVLGASGATGTLVVHQLMKRQIKARVLIRKSAIFPKELRNHPLVEIVMGNVNELNDYEMNALLHGCDVLISCLGHNMTLKGVFGKPRYLVFDAIKKMSEIVKNKDDKEVKLILMGTTGYTNTLSGEKNSIWETIIHFLLKLLVPPHRDNMKVAHYLMNEIGKQYEKVEWVVVRPDTLVNHDEESSYEVFESPIRSPLFDAGKTSRINVSHFIAELVVKDEVWDDWRFKTPVIYNQ